MKFHFFTRYCTGVPVAATSPAAILAGGDVVGLFVMEASEGDFAGAGEEMVIDHTDRWDELSDAIKVSAALNPRTKDLSWMPTQETKAWRDLLDQLKTLFQQDMRRTRGAAGAVMKGRAGAVGPT